LNFFQKFLNHVDVPFFGGKIAKKLFYNHSIQRLELAWQLSLANGAAQKKGAE
jgi:hypothetical protein